MSTITAHTGIPTSSSLEKATITARGAPQPPVQGLKHLDTQKVLDSSPVETQTGLEGDKAPALEDQKRTRELAERARLEKAYRQKMRGAEEREKALRAREESLGRVEGWQKRLKEDPLNVLTEAGISYDALTQMILQGPERYSPEALEQKKLAQELQALKQAREDDLKRQSEHQERSFEQAKKQLAGEAKIFVSSEPEYARIEEMGQIDAVPEYIAGWFQEKGELLTVEQAAKEVNAFLMEEQERLVKLPSFKAAYLRLFGGAQVAEEKEATSPVPGSNAFSGAHAKQKAVSPRHSGATTLSQSMSSASQPSSKQSWAERKAAALAKIQAAKLSGGI